MFEDRRNINNEEKNKTVSQDLHTVVQITKYIHPKNDNFTTS